VWVGVHSTSANYMVEKAIVSGWFTPQLGVFHALQREVSFAKNSRVDFVLSRHDGDGNVVHQKYVEVKSVTLAWPVADVNRCAVFPDTVSDRAAKHVTELMELIESRKRAAEDKPAATKRVELSGAIVFLVQRDDCESFMPSLIHDAKFARLCAEAEAMGIQLLPYLCRLEPDEHGQLGHVRLLHALSLHADRTKATPEAGGGAKKPSVSIKTKKAAARRRPRSGH
jgi:sugar fermentation stimulation protein A